MLLVVGVDLSCIASGWILQAYRPTFLKICKTVVGPSVWILRLFFAAESEWPRFGSVIGGIRATVEITSHWLRNSVTLWSWIMHIALTFARVVLRLARKLCARIPKFYNGIQPSLVLVCIYVMELQSCTGSNLWYKPLGPSGRNSKELYWNFNAHLPLCVPAFCGGTLLPLNVRPTFEIWDCTWPHVRIEKLSEWFWIQ